MYIYIDDDDDDRLKNSFARVTREDAFCGRLCRKKGNKTLE